MREKWVRISVETSSLTSDPLSVFLFDLGSEGVEITDIGKDWIRVSGYFPMDDSVGEKFQAIKDFLNMASSSGLSPGKWNILISTLREPRVKGPRCFGPIPVGNKLVILRPYGRRDEFKGRIKVSIKPGMAFGTGSHPTTQLCLEALEEEIKGGEVVADVGTGSGILGIAALKLGASKVLAFDMDPRAVEEAYMNASRNGVLHSFEVRLGTLDNGMINSFDIILMNITTDAIKGLLPFAVRALRKNGKILASGILGRERKEIEELMSASGLSVKRVMTKGEWVGIVASLDSTGILRS